jgi:RimJ/RimL family protein N-acetyltransferase
VTEALALVEGTGRAGPGLRWHAEYPMEETLGALGMILEAHRVAGWDGEGRPPWWLHQIVLDGEVVGDIGFHSPPPAEGPVDVEIGYNVVEALRGRGIATQACRLVLGQAWRDGAVRVRAEADNPASGTVLLRAGFTSLGYRRYVIERPVEA